MMKLGFGIGVWAAASLLALAGGAVAADAPQVASHAAASLESGGFSNGYADVTPPPHFSNF